MTGSLKSSRLRLHAVASKVQNYHEVSLMSGILVVTSYFRISQTMIFRSLSLSRRSRRRNQRKSLLEHPLSVEGQVNHLISEATDPDNLVRMISLDSVDNIFSLLRPSCTGAGLPTSKEYREFKITKPYMNSSN